MTRIQDIRREYTREKLDVEHTREDAYEQFSYWFDEAVKAEIQEVNAMVLSSLGDNDRISSRVVLLKGIEDGFVFYTNYESRKGEELAAHPMASLCFFWPQLERQIRIEGRVGKVAPSTSDEYFQSRPYGSQLGAHASPQSREIDNSGVLNQRLNELASKYPEGKVPRPEQWGGYCLKADYMEFWQGRPNRLHDRIAYELTNNRWNRHRLAP